MIAQVQKQKCRNLQLFNFFYGLPEAREVSRNLPGARGFVLPKYEPIASHDDPKCVQNYVFLGETYALFLQNICVFC